MYMINTPCVPETVREAAPMSKIGISTAGIKHRTAPLSVMSTWPTSVFSTAGNQVFGPFVTAYARVRDAKQAAPPRGTLC